MVNVGEIIEIEIDRDLREHAVDFSRRKLGFTVDTWEERNIGERDADIIMGDIAKEALKQYLNDRDISYTDYDEIRDDDFRNPAPWNMKIFNEDIERTIELKSSLARYITDINRIINEFNILAYPDQIRDIYIQAVFIQGFSVGDTCYLIGWLPRNEIAVDRNLGRLSNHPYHVDYHIEPLRNTNPLDDLELV